MESRDGNNSKHSLIRLSRNDKQNGINSDRESLIVYYKEETSVQTEITYGQLTIPFADWLSGWTFLRSTDAHETRL